MRALATLIALACTIAALGCGGDAAQPSSPPDARLGTGPDGGSDPEPATDPILVAALGDSITAGSPLWDPDPSIRRQISAAANPKSQFEYWAERRLEGGARFRNCGVFGERTDEIAERLDSCVRGVDALIVQGGINDIAQGRPVEDAASDLEAMVEEGRRVGLATTLVEVLPWDNGYPDADPEIRALNDLIAEIGARQDIRVLPFYETLEDPANPGRFDPSLTIDGDHPSIAGYRRLADLIDLPAP